MSGSRINFIGIEPIKALYYSAYLNGIIALPLLIAIMVVGNDKRIMGDGNASALGQNFRLAGGRVYVGGDNRDNIFGFKIA